MNAPTPLDRLLLPELDAAQLDALEEEAIFILRETAAASSRHLASAPRTRFSPT